MPGLDWHLSHGSWPINWGLGDGPGGWVCKGANLVLGQARSLGLWEPMGSLALQEPPGAVGISRVLGGPALGSVVKSGPPPFTLLPRGGLHGGGVKGVTESIFSILLNVSFLIFMPHPGAAISHLESLALVKVFSYMDRCSNLCFWEGTGTRNSYIIIFLTSFPIPAFSSLAI